MLLVVAVVAVGVCWWCRWSCSLSLALSVGVFDVDCCCLSLVVRCCWLLLFSVVV